MPRKGSPPNNPRGRPTVAEQIKIQERRTQAVRMASQAISWDEIATTLGYSTGMAARKDIYNEMGKRRKEAGQEVEAIRELELNKLDIVERIVWGIVRQPHVLAQHGKLIIGKDGQPIRDYAPVLAAVDRLVKIAERRAKLLKLDAPIQVEMRSTDELDAEIAGLMAELARVREEVPEIPAQSPTG